MLNEIEIYFRDLSMDAQHAVLDAVNKGGSVDIMLDDLEDDKQAELLDSAGVTDPEMMNWDTMPVTVVEFDPPKPGDPPVRRAEDMNWDTIPLTTWEYEDELEEDVFDAEENPRRGRMPYRMKPFSRWPDPRDVSSSEYSTIYYFILDYIDSNPGEDKNRAAEIVLDGFEDVITALKKGEYPV